MLNLILKPLFKNSDSNINKIELPYDTELSLSMIESGCLFVLLEEKATLIVINSLEVLTQLNNINGMSLDFELIERPEFPSLKLVLNIKTISNQEFGFDYFFNTESPAVLDILNGLKEQNNFDMLLYKEKILNSKKIQLTKDDKLKLNSLIDKVSG